MSVAGKIMQFDEQSMERVESLLQPMVGYLYRLRERMLQVGFVPSDLLFKSNRHQIATRSPLDKRTMRPRESRLSYGSSG